MSGKGSHRPGEMGALHAQSLAGVVASPVNIGRASPMSTTNAAGGFRLAKTTLISQRLDGQNGTPKGPRQLIVTLMPLTKGASNPTPWNAPWNGTSTDPASGPQPFGAPVLPDPGKGLRVELRWGAGGASVVTQFDYPAGGCCFGVTADTLDLNVIPVDETNHVYASLDVIPFVGAWFVQGQAAEPTPLQWMEIPVNIGEAGLVYYAVKPFARRLEIAAATGAVADLGVQVDWRDTSGALLKRVNIPNELLYPGQLTGGGLAAAALEIPSGATYCSVGTGNASGMLLLATWAIGLT